MGLAYERHLLAIHARLGLAEADGAAPAAPTTAAFRRRAAGSRGSGPTQPFRQAQCIDRRGLGRSEGRRSGRAHRPSTPRHGCWHCAQAAAFGAVDVVCCAEVTPHGREGGARQEGSGEWGQARGVGADDACAVPPWRRLHEKLFRSLPIARSHHPLASPSIPQASQPQWATNSCRRWCRPWAW